ncbi:MAG: ribosome silencing factor [Kiritimatiellia bacterium]
MTDSGGGTLNPEQIAQRAEAILLDKQAIDLVVLDLRERSGITDYCLVVSGTSPPHLKAMYDDVQRLLKAEGVYSYRATGDPASGWMVVDYIDVIIHIFSRKTREYYAIEKLWDQAPKPG